MNKKKILFMASNYGAATFLFPIIDLCSHKFHIGYIGITDMNIENILLNKTIKTQKDIHLNELESFDIYVTGASENSSWDYRIWKYAALNNKKSVCFLDQAKKVSKRFIKNGRLFFPDIVCVTDEYARRELSRLSSDKINSIITGYPFVKRLQGVHLTSREKARIKNDLGIVDKTVITFCTEYIRVSKARKEYGYDELDVLKDIREYILSKSEKSYKLFIRLHPKDSAQIYEKHMRILKRDFIDYELIYNDPDFKLLQLSDIVLGMTSTILIQAAALGLKIISYQPCVNPKKAIIFNNILRNNLITEKASFFKRIDVFTNSSINSWPAEKWFCVPNNRIIRIIKEL